MIHRLWIIIYDSLEFTLQATSSFSSSIPVISLQVTHVPRSLFQLHVESSWIHFTFFGAFGVKPSAHRRAHVSPLQSRPSGLTFAIALVSMVTQSFHLPCALVAKRPYFLLSSEYSVPQINSNPYLGSSNDGSLLRYLSDVEFCFFKNGLLKEGLV